MSTSEQYNIVLTLTGFVKDDSECNDHETEPDEEQGNHYSRNERKIETLMQAVTIVK